MTVSETVSRPYELLSSGATEIIETGFSWLWRTKGFKVRILLSNKGQKFTHTEVSDEAIGGRTKLAAKTRDIILAFAQVYPINNDELTTTFLRIDLFAKLHNRKFVHIWASNIGERQNSECTYSLSYEEMDRYFNRVKGPSNIADMILFESNGDFAKTDDEAVS